MPTVFWLVNSFSRNKLCPEELKLLSPKPQVYKGTTEFREHKGSYTEIRTFVHYKFRQNLKPVGENQSIFITILNCKRDEKARWAALTVHKGSYLHYRPFVHKHDQAQKSFPSACDSTPCAQRFQKSFS